ncbi:MAG: response regulator [Anaerolineae bacterium]|nr:response regulator [Anaerolineae bacterium]
MDSARILVVEDNDDARTMFGIMLRSWGYTVIEASNGTEALVAAHEEHPDLILLDIMMPDMDGYAVCRSLRSETEFQAVPILFLTALDAVDDQIQAFTIGADDFLTKSKLDYNTLGVRIKAALERTERIQQAVSAKIQKTGMTIGMLSLRGGVGVSTLALNLAYQAATQQDQPTLLIDMSFPVGSLGLWNGISDPRNIVELLSRKPAEITLPLLQNFSVQTVHGFYIIPAPAMITDTGRVRGESVEKILNLLQREGYFIILDLGRGTLPLQWHVPARCDWTVIVTSDESTSRKLAKVAVETLPEQGIDSRSLLVLLNDITHAQPEDLSRDLPRAPDVTIPFIPNLQEIPAPSPVSALWSIVGRLEKEAVS